MNDYEYKHRKDAASLICDCFYVDDGLSSVQDEKLLNIENKTNGMLRIVNKPYTCSDSSIDSLYGERIATFHWAVVTSRYV